MRGIDIADWHTFRHKRGLPVLSSRRLLHILAGLDADSNYKRVARDGDYSDGEYFQSGILNELRLLRTDQAAINGQTMKPVLIESPRQQKASEASAKERRVVQRTISQRLRGGKAKTT